MTPAGREAEQTTLHRPDEELLTIPEAAQRAGVSYATIMGWIRSGHLPATLVRSRWRLDAQDLLATQAATHLGSVIPAWRRNPEHAGQRVRLLREAAGLTQQDLAARSGLTHEAISVLELARRTPEPETVRKLAQGLEVDPELFVGCAPFPSVGLTTAEVAGRLEVPRERVRRWMRTGKLPGVMVSGDWRVPREVVLDLERRERLRGKSRRLDPRYRG